MSSNDEDSQRSRGCTYSNALHNRQTEPAAINAESTNPFVAFKRFVDSQFATITSFPSRVTELKRKMQIERMEQKERELVGYRRWTGREGTPDHDDLRVQRMTEDDLQDAHEMARLLVLESVARNAHISPDKIQSLYRDEEFMAIEQDRFAGPMLSFGGACYYMPETGDNLPSTASIFGRWPSLSPKWLSIDWFKNSVYSPVQVEAHPLMMGRDTLNWRAAFEDLLLASLDKDMGTRAMIGTRPLWGTIQNTWRGPGLDWMLSLQCRGILPPQLPSLYQQHTRPYTKEETSQLVDTVGSGWREIAGRWGPGGPERDFAELTKEVAIPPAAERTDVFSPDLEMDSYVPGSLPDIPPCVFPPGLPELQPTTDSTNSTSDLRPVGKLTPAATAFWQALEAQNTSAAAIQVTEWEKHGRDTRELISDEQLIQDYLAMDTEPHFWPLCEALERADSKLLHEQSRIAGTSPSNDQSNMTDILNDYGLQLIVLSEQQIRMLQQQLQELRNARPDSTEPEQSILERRIRSLQGKLSERKAKGEWEEYHKELESRHALEEREDDDADETFHSIEQWATQLEADRRSDALEPRATKKQDEKPSVLAALTTTHTTRLPDGTVTTKTVLKKRFTDGREETTESVHVQQAEKQDSLEAKDPKSKKNGWFWS